MTLSNSMFRPSHYEFMSACWNRSSSRAIHLFLRIKQVKQLHDGQEVSQSVLLNAAGDELQQHPHQVIPSLDQTPTGQLFRRGTQIYETQEEGLPHVCFCVVLSQMVHLCGLSISLTCTWDLTFITMDGSFVDGCKDGVKCKFHIYFFDLTLKAPIYWQRASFLFSALG